MKTITFKKWWNSWYFEWNSLSFQPIEKKKEKESKRKVVYYDENNRVNIVPTVNVDPGEDLDEKYLFDFNKGFGGWTSIPTNNGSFITINGSVTEAE